MSGADPEIEEGGGAYIYSGAARVAHSCLCAYV